MATDPHIQNRKSVRPRGDNTVVHGSAQLSASNTAQSIRLDIVCKKITVQVSGDGSFAVTITGSIDGTNYFSIAAGKVNGDIVTYGTKTDNSEHLVKHIKATRTAGTGQITVVGV